MNKEKMIVETKNGSAWNETYTTENPERIYKSLSNDLIAKKLNKCTFIKSIKRVQLYTGFIQIIVTYNGTIPVRRIYTIAEV